MNPYQSFETCAPEPLSLRDIAAWQFKALAAEQKPKIIAGIPSLQRGAVWNAGQVELLWDSILRGFPIGSLVVCEKLANQETRSGIHGRGGWDKDDIKYHLLDGQQRCNAIALGFVDALATSHDDNAKMPPATLWIDLDPERLRGRTRQFHFRMLTTAHPWGYRADDAAEFLGVPAIREAVAKYADGKRPKITMAWPHASRVPIPFAWLSNAVLVDKIVERDLWGVILEKCKVLQGRYWANKAATLIENHINGSVRNNHISRIQRGLCTATAFVVAALKVPKSALQEQSLQEELEEDSEPENGNRIYNVEHLFQRLNSAGTELRGEELTFSMIKAYWPLIEQSFEAIQDKDKNKHQPMIGSRLATLGARAALIGTEKQHLPAPLSISRIRSLAYPTTDKARAEKNCLEEYFGIRHLQNGTNVQESNLHKNLRQIDEWLLFDNSIDNDYGLPPVLRSSLAQDAPDVFLLLLHLAQKTRTDNLAAHVISALRKPILGLATALHWFGDDRAAAVANLYTSHFTAGLLSQDAFSGILKHCLRQPNARCEFLKLLSPDKIIIPTADASDANLPQWNLWKRIVEVEKDQTKREMLARDEWHFLVRVIYSNALLLYCQRAFLSTDLTYDPSCTDIWKGHNRPWDYDHILPSATLANNPGLFRVACREWSNTIGNLRAWPLEKNRSRHHEIANKSVLPNEFTNSFILDENECEAFSLHWSDINSPMKAALFMNATRNRVIRIYKDWFDSLDIGKLLSDM